MGQVIGKGRIHADALPFINLEPDRVEKLWSHYKLHSDGFALDPDALQHVLKIIYEDDEAFERLLDVWTVGRHCPSRSPLEPLLLVRCGRARSW